MAKRKLVYGYNNRVYVKIAEEWVAMLGVTTLNINPTMETESFYPAEDEGAENIDFKGRKCEISITAKKYSTGTCAVQDLFDDLAYEKDPEQLYQEVRIVRPNGKAIEGTALIDVTNPGSGSTEASANMEVTIRMSGNWNPKATVVNA